MPQAQAYPDAPQSLEEQLRAAYALVDELHDMEVRLRTGIDTALATLKKDVPDE